MKKVLALLMVLAVSLFAVSAFAYDVKVDDDTYAKIGAKAQIRVTALQPDPGDNEVNVDLQQARWYVAGQVTNLVKFGINYDFTRQGAKATDAFITLDMSKEAKIMTGIYRVAFSRVGLQDSYQFILIDAPSVVNDVAAVNDSTGSLSPYRNAGITLWGDLMDGKLRYNVGIWEDDYSGLTGSDDKYLMTGRVVFNFADPEKGYTCPGCYLGKANVMNVGFGYAMNDYKVAGASRTATAMTVDFFYDQNGTTLEAAYLMSDLDSGAVGAEPSGFYVEAAHMVGNWQPAARYESFDADGLTGVDGDYDTITVGVNYLWSGHDAKLQLAYSMKDYDTAATADQDTLTAQLQVQF